MTVKITMRPASDDRRNSYGVLFESTTLHRVSGAGVHNPSFPHRIQVWLNKNGRTPDGETATEQLTVMTSAEPVMIASTPVDRDPRGDALSIGETVEVEGFGEYVITSKSLHDPVLVAVRSEDGDDEDGCEGHPAGPFDPMGETVYCDGSCRR